MNKRQKDKLKKFNEWLESENLFKFSIQKDITVLDGGISKDIQLLREFDKQDLIPIVFARNIQMLYSVAIGLGFDPDDHFNFVLESRKNNLKDK